MVKYVQRRLLILNVFKIKRKVILMEIISYEYPYSIEQFKQSVKANTKLLGKK